LGESVKCKSSKSIHKPKVLERSDIFGCLGHVQVFMLLLLVPLISLSSIVFSLQVVSLSEPRFIVLTPDLLFHSVCSCLTGHIRPQARHIWLSPNISNLRPNISGPVILTGLN
jgi:hypothetical protein